MRLVWVSISDRLPCPPPLALCVHCPLPQCARANVALTESSQQEVVQRIGQALVAAASEAMAASSTAAEGTRPLAQRHAEPPCMDNVVSSMVDAMEMARTPDAMTAQAQEIPEAWDISHPASLARALDIGAADLKAAAASGERGAAVKGLAATGGRGLDGERATITSATRWLGQVRCEIC